MSQQAPSFAGLFMQNVNRHSASTGENNGVRWVINRLGEELWSKQKLIMQLMETERRVAVKSAHGVGKALALDTPINTSTGWTTQGALRVGDVVFDERGQPCNVTNVGAIHERDSYRVCFTDGTAIVAADTHEWRVRTPRGYMLRETRELIGCWRTNGPGRMSQFSVDVTAPVEYAEAELPIDPYLLGYWLGDGDSRRGYICVHINDAENLTERLGCEDWRVPRSRQERSTIDISIRGLSARLRDLGVLRNKHIPEMYLRASIEQRRALLAGLLDSDGCASNTRADWSSCTPTLAIGTLELVRSLGEKPTIRSRPAKLNGRIVGTSYMIGWTPIHGNPFGLTRKRDALQQVKTTQTTRRVIESVEPVGIARVRCIEVDSPSHLYLAGEAMVPTHNSHIASRIAAQHLDDNPVGEAFLVSTAPSNNQVKMILWRYIGQAHRKGNLLGRVNQTEWLVDAEPIGFGRKPADWDPEAFQGIHALKVFVIIDEAGGVPKTIWDAAETLLTNEHCRVLAIGNPDDPTSHFAKVCAPGSGWHVETISAFDSPNFTDEVVSERLSQMLVGPVYVDDAKKNWGEDSALYVSKVLGEFPEDAEDGVVPASAIARCRKLSPDSPYAVGPTDDLPNKTLEKDDETDVQLGIDVGAGGDATVIRERRGNRAARVWRSRHADPMRLVGEIVEKIRRTEAKRVAIDAIGIGWGIAGRLEEVCREQQIAVEIVPVNVAKKSSEPRRFINLRAELWWTIGRELSQDEAWDLTQIDDQTAADLAAPKYTTDSAGRIKVELKDEVRARIGRSPDDADALLLAFTRTARATLHIARDLSTQVFNGSPGRATI